MPQRLMLMLLPNLDPEIAIHLVYPLSSFVWLNVELCNQITCLESLLILSVFSFLHS